MAEEGDGVKYLLHSGKFLFLDMASTILFLVLLQVTHSVPLAVTLGMALGVAQIAWQLARKQPIDTIQWMSLALVVGGGGATLLTHDPRFVMFKPTLIYLVVGAAMLKPSWQARYMTPIALEMLPDMIKVFGYVWSGMMFASAGLNLVLLFSLDVKTWAAVMSVWALSSKIVLFLIQFATMRLIGRARRSRRAALAPA